jgi:hypothetical protein
MQQGSKAVQLSQPRAQRGKGFALDDGGLWPFCDGCELVKWVFNRQKAAFIIHE